MTDIYKWSTVNWVSSFNSSWLEFDEYFKEFRIPPLQKVIRARDIFAHCLNSACTLVTRLALHCTSNTYTYKLHLKSVNKLQAHFADTNKNHTTVRKPHPSITAHTFFANPNKNSCNNWITHWSITAGTICKFSGTCGSYTYNQLWLWQRTLSMGVFRD